MSLFFPKQNAASHASNHSSPRDWPWEKSVKASARMSKQCKSGKKIPLDSDTETVSTRSNNRDADEPERNVAIVVLIERHATFSLYPRKVTHFRTLGNSLRGGRHHVCVVRRDELACHARHARGFASRSQGGRGARARGRAGRARRPQPQQEERVANLRAKRGVSRRRAARRCRRRPLPPSTPWPAPWSRTRPNRRSRKSWRRTCPWRSSSPREPRRRGRRRRPTRYGEKEAVAASGSWADAPQTSAATARRRRPRASRRCARSWKRRSPSSSWATGATSWVSARATPRTTTSGTKTRRRTPNASPRPRAVSLDRALWRSGTRRVKRPGRWSSTWVRRWTTTGTTTTMALERPAIEASRRCSASTPPRSSSRRATAVAGWWRFARGLRRTGRALRRQRRQRRRDLLRGGREHQLARGLPEEGAPPR